MKKLYFIVVLLMLSITTAKSQNKTSSYRTALGAKVWGDGAGLSLKHFIRNNHALEGVLYFWNGGSRITGLYEFHFDFEGAPGLKWYIGPGVHLGSYNESYYYNNKYGGTYIGIDGVLGLDYKFSGVPINLSLDWQPSIEFGSNRGVYGGWGGLGIRYAF